MTSEEFRGRIDNVRNSLLAVEQQILDLDPPSDVLNEFHAALDQVRTSVWAAVASKQQGARQVVAQVRLERASAMCRQTVLDLEHTFGIGALRGSLRIFADSEVGLTLLKKVTNVHGELIFSDVPLQEASDETRERLTFPLFSNGAGHATEVVLLNPSTYSTDGRLSIRNAAGEALVTILR